MEQIFEVSTLISLGYEGRNAGELIEQLLQQNVSVLVDVRLTPLSRKPGLSKRKLAAALDDNGIKYVHLPQLGNPKDNRDLFRSGDPESRQRFRDLLRTPGAELAIQHVAELVDGGVVALLCFERDHTTCHRALVSAELIRSRPGVLVTHI